MFINLSACLSMCLPPCRPSVCHPSAVRLHYNDCLCFAFICFSSISKSYSKYPVKIRTPRYALIREYFLDLKMKKLEFYNNTVENVLSSNIYKYFIKNG